jgi:chromosome segregation ATPase
MSDASSSSLLLQISDPVFVQHIVADDATVHQLEGVVSYIGPVPELQVPSSSSSANSKDERPTENCIYYGIRLTGSSVGMGINYDAYIKFQELQERYFACPIDSAVFVPSSSVNTITKRNLSRLESLRLRRELASSTTTTTSSSINASTQPTISSTSVPSGRLTPPSASKIPMKAAASSTPSATTGSSAMSKLEELRMRREALKAAKQQQQPAPEISVETTMTTSSSSNTPIKISGGSLDLTSPEPSPLISGKNDQTMQWQNRIDDLAQQLTARDKENINLNSELLKYKDENKNYKSQVVELQQNLATALQQASSALPSETTAETSRDSTEFRALQEENEQLHASYSEIKDQLEEVRQELTACQIEIKEKALAHENALVELTRSRAEATSYQNQLRAQTDQNDQRGMSDAVHYKERAKLSADISALKRKVEQLEREKMELEAAIEDITLDKEQLQEEKDAIEEKYDDLKLDAETAQMEVEELRIELEDAKATAGRVMGVADTLTAAAMASAGSPSKANVSDNESGDTAEMIQVLQTQNARLREALIRLREQSSLEKMEMTRQLRTVEKAAETNTAVQNRVEELTAINQNLNEQVNDLKDMVEQGAAFESMVEDLSDRVLGLEEQNVALNTILRELEEAAELTTEMEEVQADELKALSRDLEGRDTMIRNLEEAIKM